jgi:hypothetical protein
MNNEKILNPIGNIYNVLFITLIYNQQLNINYDYCDTNHVHVDRTLSTLRRLLNPIDIQETKTICHFIQSAFSIHCS